MALYPKDIEANLEYRNELWKMLENPEQAGMYWHLCERDILTFFNTALWTYDPRQQAKDLPFITYPFQDEFILWAKERIETQSDGLCDKSRDMGVSWMMYGVLIWFFIFRPSFSALIGSYIEGLVDDKNNMDTHFARLDYLLEHLPPCLTPKYQRSYMKLINASNKSSIVGYAPTEKFSRQGRYSVIWPDEFAFWQYGRAAWTSMGDATKCRIPTSTVNGKGNKFAELSLKSSISKKTLHWSLHPLKDEAWYEAQKFRRTAEEIAQELDINYDKSLKGRVYPEFSEHNYKEFQEYDPSQPLFVSWDFGGSDPTSMIWLQKDRTTEHVRIIDAYESPGKTIDFFVPFVTGVLKSGLPYVYTEEEIDMINRHKKWQPAIHFGDPTGGNKNQVTRTSVISELNKEGIYINVNYKKFEHVVRQRMTKMLIRRLHVDKRLEALIDAITGYRFPERAENSQSTTPISEPVHDWASHYSTALEYFAVNEDHKPEKVKSHVTGPSETEFEERLRLMEKKMSSKMKSTPTYRRSC